MPATKLTVLIVDDEAAHAEAIRRALEGSGIVARVDVVGTVREYHERLAAGAPHTALIDLNLPDGRAIELLKYPPEDGDFPILVMTSYGNEHTAVEALQQGALDYIVKSPQAFAEIPRTVERALREWDLRRERKQGAQALQERDADFVRAQRLAHVGNWVLVPPGDVPIWSDEMFCICGVDPGAGVPSYTDHRKFIHPDDWQRLDKAVAAAYGRGEPYELELRVVHPDGSLRHVVSLCAPEVGPDGRVVRLAGTVQDITERVRAEAEVDRLYRLVATRSDVNQLIVREDDEKQLLEGVCRIVVERGGFLLAAVSMVTEEEGGRQVRPVAQHGDDGGYLAERNILLEDPARCSGPTGQAILTGQAQVSLLNAADPAMLPWRDAALARGYQVSAAFPLHLDDHVIGTLDVYAGTPELLAAGEVAQLAEIAADVSFALTNFKREQRRREAEQAQHESEHRYHVLADSVTDVIWTLSLDGHFTYITPSVLQLRGYTAEEVLQQQLEEAVCPGSVASVRAAIEGDRRRSCSPAAGRFTGGQHRRGRAAVQGRQHGLDGSPDARALRCRGPADRDCRRVARHH